MFWGFFFFSILFFSFLSFLTYLKERERAEPRGEGERISSGLPAECGARRQAGLDPSTLRSGPQLKPRV